MNIICQLSGQLRDALKVDRYVQSDNAVYFFGPRFLFSHTILDSQPINAKHAFRSNILHVGC